MFRFVPVSVPKLSAEEAAEARRLRELVEKDKAEGRHLLAEKRLRQAAARGAATLGQTIRAAREARGLTQAKLAASAHVAQAYLSYLEQDQREPSLSIAARIARELAILLDELARTVTRSDGRRGDGTAVTIRTFFSPTCSLRARRALPPT